MPLPRKLQKKTSEAKTRLLAGASLMGFLLEDPAAWLGYGDAGHDNTVIDNLVQERDQAQESQKLLRGLMGFVTSFPHKVS